MPIEERARLTAWADSGRDTGETGRRLKFDVPLEDCLDTLAGPERLGKGASRGL